MSSEIKVYPVTLMNGINLRKRDLKNSGKNNYQNTPRNKKLPKTNELNFLEILLEARNKGNYI